MIIVHLVTGRELRKIYALVRRGSKVRFEGALAELKAVPRVLVAATPFATAQLVLKTFVAAQVMNLSHRPEAMVRMGLAVDAEVVVVLKSHSLAE